MSQLARIAFVGNAPPRRCGIATFTADLHQSIAQARPDLGTSIVAMNDRDHAYDYSDVVKAQIAADRPEDYLAAAEFLNRQDVDVVSLQHEFGIFGGEAGSSILPLLSRLRMPVVTTLHTVLTDPTERQRDVLNRIVALSAQLVVMTNKARDVLRHVYGVAPRKIEVIAHGVPDTAYEDPDAAKRRSNEIVRPTILTFGLLSPNKGIEVMIDAMPRILKDTPDALYVVLGATHPNLVRNEGEVYRDSLRARVAQLGIERHVRFLDQFVDQAELLRHIAMCDVYVTPYLNRAQMTSGTLAYSFGLGRPVVSTPYWHAEELLADGRGMLVPFGDSDAIGRAVSGLLRDADSRHALGERAYRASRTMTWPRTAETYLGVFERVVATHPRKPITVWAPTIVPRRLKMQWLPRPQLGHLKAMCDDIGILQHAVLDIPDRAHGYCVDDNARGLLLDATLAGTAETALPVLMASRFAAFVQHAWNPDTRRFRNFMGFDRRWLEDAGSEDSHGRTLWALGVCARRDEDPVRRRWAAGLFGEALPTVDGFRSPRAIAFTLLGLAEYCEACPQDGDTARRQLDHAETLLAALCATETEDWVWFEDGLAYDNARLPQALLVTGQSLGRDDMTAAGLRALHWLVAVQTSPSDQFRPVGSAGFGALRTAPDPFDQQPLEATATISACLAAFKADGSSTWKLHANRAFAWFLGDNDLSIPLVDLATGACRDGLHPDRANENRGAESVLAYLQAVVELRVAAQASGDDRRFAVAAAPNV